MKLRIAGYTSAAGSEEYNQDLSERRAGSVKEYLVKTGGIDANRLATIGYGKTSPAKFEANPSDKLSAEAYANMRVVIEIIEE
jgi:OOP family OmpA-OmpF porin